MAKKVKVNQDTCIGCGMCMSFADAVFAFNNDGKAEAANPDVPADLESAVDEAAASCPAAAIEVE